MSKDKNLIAIILAILAAALYAISTPVSKVMLQTVAPTMVAAFLYLGAGIGMGAMMLVRSGRHRTTEERLHRSDIPYAVAQSKSQFIEHRQFISFQGSNQQVCRDLDD